MIERDPDKIPDFNPEGDALARSMGLRQISVICDEPGAKVGDPSGVQFIAYVDFIPQIGETIILQDGTQCNVTRVFHRVAKAMGGPISMMPTVKAVAVRPKSSTDI